MKSNRAKEYIQDKDNQLWSVDMGVPLYVTFDVEKTVELAEQDAEERAIKAAKEWFVKLFPAITNQATIDIMADDFIELYNNGGKNNE